MIEGKVDNLIHAGGAHAVNGEGNACALDVVGFKLTWDMVRHTLCSALEGGSNYWYCIAEFIPPTVGDVPWDGEEVCFRHLDYPCREGGALIIIELGEEEPKRMRLDRAALVEGLKVMATKYTKHFADVMTETGDAITGDVLLQCACFGELIYG